MNAPFARSTRLSLLAGALLAPASLAGVTVTVDTLDDTVDAAPGDGVCADANGNCSLRAAVQEANASNTSSVIRLAAGEVYTLSIAGTDEDDAATGDIDVLGHIVIEGKGATIDGADLDRLFDVAAGGSLTLRDVTLTGGFVTDANGGALRNAGSLTVERSSLVDNVATGAGASGGAIVNDGGAVFLDRSTLSGNTATRAGGAVEAVGGLTSIVGCDVSDNETGAAPGNGGGLHLTGTGLVNVVRSDFTGNRAASEGGALWNSSTGTMTVDRSDFVMNSADGEAADNGGGALFNDGGDLTVRRALITGNLATAGSGSGGAILNDGGSLRVELTAISENAASRAGGAIEAVAGSTTLTRVRLLANTAGSAPGNGGALHLTGEGTVTVDRCRVEENVASAEGGGLWNSSSGTMHVFATTLRNNVASGDDADQGGGGLFNDGGQMVVERSLLIGNIADGASGSGGGLLNNLGTVLVADTRMRKNASMRAGGGIEANVGTTSLYDVRLSGNVTGAAPGNGGGLHLTGAGLVTIEGGAASKNDASNEGGGLWNSAVGTMVVNDMNVTGNTSPNGPDLFNDGGTFTVDGVDVPVGP